MISLLFKHKNQLNKNLKINKIKNKMKMLRILKGKKKETGKEIRIKTKEMHDMTFCICNLFIIFNNVFN